MAYPVSRALTRMSGSFGPRKPIRLSNGQLSPAFHGGVDFTPLAAGSKLPTYAVGRGVVYGVGLGGKAAGLNVMLRLSDGSLWWYCHLSRVDVAKGQAVADGQQIGHIGATGNTTGVHLHLERHYPRIDAETDPWPFIKDEPDPTGKTGDKAAADEGGLTMSDIAAINARLDVIEEKSERARFAAEWCKSRIAGSVYGKSITELLGDAAAPDTDPKLIADTIAAELGDDIARQVLDALGKRITNG